MHQLWPRIAPCLPWPGLLLLRFSVGAASSASPIQEKPVRVCLTASPIAYVYVLLSGCSLFLLLHVRGFCQSPCRDACPALIYRQDRNIQREKATTILSVQGNTAERHQLGAKPSSSSRSPTYSTFSTSLFFPSLTASLQE